MSYVLYRTWLDAGGHIGAFVVFAKLHDAEGVITYENLFGSGRGLGCQEGYMVVPDWS